MVLRLVLGRAGSGKSEFCMGEIAGELRERPDGFPLIYIVPEQATFQEEYALAAAPGLGGTIRAQVLSFRRLAWKIMQEVGGAKRLFIDDTGKGMVLRKVLEKEKGGLKLFKHAGEQSGVLDNLVQLHKELKRSCISLSQFRETFQKRVAAGEDLPSLFKEKVGDLLHILEQTERELEGLYMDGEDYLGMLAKHLPRSSYLQGAEVWVDGFYGFTEQEYTVLEGLFRHCRRVTVTVCLDRYRSPGEWVDEVDPFYPAAVTCKKLQQKAEECGVPVEKVLLEKEGLPRFAERPELAYLERNLHSYPITPYVGDTTSLTLAAAPNRRCEVESLAREMTRRVRDEGYRWREMAVVVSELDDYRDILSTVFGDYNIPFFLDQKRQVLHHPLVEFIRSAMEVVNRGWRYDAVFRCVKTEFLLPLVKEGQLRRMWRERADRLENYVLAFGIQGRLWLREEPWDYLERDSLEEEGDVKPSSSEENYLERINETRRIISGPLARFQESFRAAVTVKEKAAALYGLLLDVNAWERMELWSEEALKGGGPEDAREHLQVYKGIVELMDQLVELMGEEEISSALFARIVESGMDGLRLSLVPPSLDQVLVGNVERSRWGRVRLVYLLGVNDGVLPSRPKDDGIFSEKERETVSRWGLELALGGSRRLLDEQFLIYIAMTRASCGLWISYPLADEEGRALVPSMLIARLKELFPALREEILSGEPEDEYVEDRPASSQEVGEVCEEGFDETYGSEIGAEGAAGEDETAAETLLAYVAHPRRALSHLAVQLGRWKKGRELHPLWWDVYNWYAKEESWREPSKRLLGGILYENREKPLEQETSLQLYGRQLTASVSRLERFRACPFSHFVSHGLRLRERRIYRLESPDIGRFFHAALRNFAFSLQERGLEWGELDAAECLQLAEAEVERLVPRLQKEILLSSNRYRYLAEKLKETVGRAVLILSEHARRSAFRPVGLELAFGEGGALPPLNFELENGCRVEMVGRIDRVDMARDDGGRVYLRIIDYKSGRADLKLPELYYGLSMQMLAYLDIVLTHSLQWLGEKAHPAGVLYFRVHTPLINADAVLPAEKIEEEIRKRYKMKGKVLGDVKVVQLMDSSLQSGVSEIIPVGLTRDGEFYSNSAILTGQRFELLRGHTRSLIREGAREITSGRVDIAPYRLGKDSACTYCPYKAVCQFDTMLDENGYRILRSEEEEQIWSYLEQCREMEEEGGDENGR